MVKGLLKTSDSIVDLLLRLTLAAVFFPHGAQKVPGWFGGYGLTATYGAFTEKMGIPGFLAALVFAAEFLGPPSARVSSCRETGFHINKVGGCIRALLTS